MSWQTNFKDTAHYVPLTGEIRASKIQGEGRGYPDSVSGDADYVGNPTGIAKPEEMRLDDRRYRKMCFPDGRYPYDDYFSLVGGTGRTAGGKIANVIGGKFYPAWGHDAFWFQSFYGGPQQSARVEYNPFRGISMLISNMSGPTGSGPNNEPRWSYEAIPLYYDVPNQVVKPKPHRTQISYRKERPVEDNNFPYFSSPSNMATTGFAVNQIKYARGLNRTDNDWRPSGGGNVGMYGFGYTEDELGHSTAIAGVSQGLDGLNKNGDGPFNVPISDAGEIRFSDFRGKNKFYKTYGSIGKNEAVGANHGNYPSTNTSWDYVKLGNQVAPTYLNFGFSSSLGNAPNRTGQYEFVGLVPHFWGYQTVSASDDGLKADGSRLGARGYVNPDFGGIPSPSGITLPTGAGAMQHTSNLNMNLGGFAGSGTNAVTANADSRFKPLFASKSISEPINSATIGRYSTDGSSMPSYDYVNQGTGSTNYPPIVSNPRDGEMTHCIWYVPNATGTGAWNANKDLGTVNSEGSDIGYSLPTSFDGNTPISNSPGYGTPSSTGLRRSHYVIEFGVLGRHHVDLDLVSAVYWDSNFRSGNMGNTGNSADEGRGGGAFIDGTNVRADLATDNAEIFYVSPNADNLYYGQTVWRCGFDVAKQPNSGVPGSTIAVWQLGTTEKYYQGGVPLSSGAVFPTNTATRVVFQHGRPDSGGSTGNRVDWSDNLFGVSV